MNETGRSRWARASTLLVSLAVIVGCSGAQDGEEVGVPEEVSVDEEAASREVRSKRVNVMGSEVHVLEAGSGESTVLLLHGARFSAATWRDLGTLEVLAAASHRAVALDLPGYGESPAADHEDHERGAFLAAAIEELGLARPVVVSPSMSGAFSLALIERSPDALAGFVAIAPAAIARHEKLSAPELPALLVWGSADTIIPLSAADDLAARLPRARRVVFEGASHPCYLDVPEAFHRELLTFLAEL